MSIHRNASSRPAASQVIVSGTPSPVRSNDTGSSPPDVAMPSPARSSTSGEQASCRVPAAGESGPRGGAGPRPGAFVLFGIVAPPPAGLFGRSRPVLIDRIAFVGVHVASIRARRPRRHDVRVIAIGIIEAENVTEL